MNQIKPSPTDPEPRTIISWIMAALTVWGLLLAAGATLFGYDPHSRTIDYSFNPVRGLIVFGCVVSFIAFWAAVLRRRGSKQPME